MTPLDLKAVKQVIDVKAESRIFVEKTTLDIFTRSDFCASFCVLHAVFTSWKQLGKGFQVELSVKNVSALTVHLVHLIINQHVGWVVAAQWLN